MSSWRTVARAAVEREEQAQPDCADHFGNNDNFAGASARADDLEEREAIAIVDGGLPPEWAVSLSMLEREARPGGISERDWRVALDKIWTRADLHAAEFVANGWTFEEAFGVGVHWLCGDHMGGGWLALDGRIVEITPLRIVFERGSDRTTHTKPQRPN